MQRAWVPCLVGALRPPMLCSMARSVIIIIKHLEETLAGNRMYYRGDPQLKNKKCTNFNVRTSVHEICLLSLPMSATPLAPLVFLNTQNCQASLFLLKGRKKVNSKMTYLCTSFSPKSSLVSMQHEPKT